VDAHRDEVVRRHVPVPDLAEAAGKRAARSHALLLANHGPVVAGATLEAAVDAVEVLEQTARVFLLLRGAPVRLLTDAEVRQLR